MARDRRCNTTQFTLPTTVLEILPSHGNVVHGTTWHNNTVLLLLRGQGRSEQPAVAKNKEKKQTKFKKRHNIILYVIHYKNY
jgi:hypothetical protein